jgi:hypothetical protein
MLTTHTRQDYGGGEIAPLSKLPPPHLSNINEESTQHSGGDSGVGSAAEGEDEFNCCAFDLCRSTMPSYDAIVFCMECQRQCHLPCAVDFYLQTGSTKASCIPMTAFSNEAKKRCKAARIAIVHENQYGSADPDFAVENNTASRTTYFCLQCKDMILSLRSKKSNPKNKTSSLSTTNVQAATKKIVKQALPDSIRKELWRAASFYCRSKVFAGDTTKLDGCKVLMAKHFYGDNSKELMGAVDMVVDGTGPFKDLYDEYVSEAGKERVLKPWLCGVDTPVHYVPGVHFTAESIAEVSKKDGRKASGATLWRESLDVVKVGKKAISFVPNVDVCEYDSSTFAVTSLKSGHTMQEVYEEINNLTLAWANEDEKKAANEKKAEIDEFVIDDSEVAREDEESGSGKRFLGFFAFYLFGPTRQGSRYNSLWRRSEDAISIIHDGDMEGRGKKIAEKKRKAKELDAERKKRREEDAQYRDHRRKYEIATVAQAKDELESQRFDSEVAQLMSLIDTATSTVELKMRLQERCEDPVCKKRWGEEIEELMTEIDMHRKTLGQLQHNRQQSSKKHVDAFLGGTELDADDESN